MILSVGVIQTRKNTLNMLKALKTLPAEYKLVLSGGNGYGSEAIHEFIRAESLHDRVKLLGYVDDAVTGSTLPGRECVPFSVTRRGFRHSCAGSDGSGRSRCNVQCFVHARSRRGSGAVRKPTRPSRYCGEDLRRGRGLLLYVGN